MNPSDKLSDIILGTQNGPHRKFLLIKEFGYLWNDPREARTMSNEALVASIRQKLGLKIREPFSSGLRITMPLKD